MHLLSSFLLWLVFLSWNVEKFSFLGKHLRKYSRLTKLPFDEINLVIFLSFFSHGFHGHCWGFLGLPFSTDIPQFSRNVCYRGSHGLLASWKTLFQQVGHNHQLFQVKVTKYYLHYLVLSLAQYFILKMYQVEGKSR